MRHIIFAVGYGADESYFSSIIKLIHNDITEEDQKKIQYLNLVDSDPKHALMKIKDCIKYFFKGIDEKDVVLAYSGENFYLLKYQLHQCQQFDILKLIRMIEESVPNEGLLKNDEMVNELFLGGILRLLKVDE